MSRPSYDPDWRQRYAHKLRSADDALRVVRSGHHIFVGSGAAVPQYLVDRLTARADHLHAAEIVHIMTLGLAPYALPPVKESFRHNAFFVGPNVRDAVATGEADARRVQRRPSGKPYKAAPDHPWRRSMVTKSLSS